ncbi:MAG TPA: hypothetical protein VMV21_18090 [Vicinamibacteria bacterium]|nr:hypothetical protein [Vicinamibacteria bacterium]
MNLPESVAPARPALLAALIHTALLVSAITLLPRPQSAPRGILLSALWLAPPALLAFAASVRKARSAQGSERVFWAFLASTCGLYAGAVGLFLWRGLGSEGAGLAKVLGLAAYHGWFALLLVGLLVPLDRPAASGEVRKAALEWLLIAMGMAFLVAYFALLPTQSSPWLGFVLYTAEELLPAILMLRSAWLTGEPHRSVFRILAIAFGAAALIDFRGNWLYVTGRYEPYTLLTLAWTLPVWGVVVAARVRTTASWLVQPSRARGLLRTRYAAIAVAIPPLVELGARALRLPGEGNARSLLALAASAILAMLVALRLRPPESPSAAPLPDPMDHDGLPELRRLATGTAHEINNPLMAAVVAAELAVARGGEEAPLRALQDAVHGAATAVRRFQLVASGRDRDVKE